MASKNTSEKPIGIIGAGSFGTAMTHLLSQNSQVLVYARKPEVIEQLNEERTLNKRKVNENVRGTANIQELAESCDIIFPVVPSSGFREMLGELSPHLHPYHILIHGTKGLDLSLPPGKNLEDMDVLERQHIKTMSELIEEESVVVRIGCLAGPNLATEILEGHPAATVVASHFNEVIQAGQRLIRSDRFQVYGNPDLIGIELCGILKNIIAIAAGALHGLGFGENANALLVSRGMIEMIYVGKALGGKAQSFVGLAGVGDLVATCSSTLSRNFTVGYRLAKGDSLEEINRTMEETAEGINTVRIVKKLVESMKLRAPITEVLYKILYEGLTVEEGLDYLMKYPLNVDIDFL